MTTKTKKSDRHPRLHFTAPAQIVAAAGDEDSGPPTFEMVAYTGGPMYVSAFVEPVVVDLDGIRGMEKSRPILKDHSRSMVVGHTKSMSVEGGQLIASGVVSGANTFARDVVAAAKNGFPWQASIGADPLAIEDVSAGATVEVNGRQIEGPAVIVRQANIREISVVAIGADDETVTSIAAEAAEEFPMPEKGKTAPEPAPEATPAAAAPVEASADQVGRMRLEAAAELDRIAKIRQIAKDEPEIAAEAVKDNWSPEKTENAVLKAQLAARESESMTAPYIAAGGGGEAPAGPVLEAAFAATCGLTNLEKHYDAQTLEAAHRQYRGRLALGQMLLEAAAANGYRERAYRITDSNGPAILRAAFSTRSLSGILGNVANKMVMDAFNRVDSAWREVAQIRPVSDFKTVTTYRLTGETKYAKLSPGGKIQHGDVGEASYTNKADTYARMVGLDRHDIINDDAGALADMMTRLGAGAGKKINEVFWTEFLDNSTFFTAGTDSYFEGASSALSIDSLSTAEALFMEQTDEEGDPIGYSPSILLVPPALRATAFQLFNSTNIVTGEDATFGETNPHAGRYRPVATPYLNSSSISGSSSTAWYLLADPNDLPVIQLVALDGRTEPVVEQSDAMFDELGILFRGYHDFGVSKMEYRGGVKSKGAA